MQRHIYWLTLNGDADDAAFVNRAVNQLIALLNASIPEITLTASEISPTLAAQIHPQLHAGHLDGAVKSIRDVWNNNVRSHVTIYSPDSSHPAVRTARLRLQHAHWGISLSGTLSLTYATANRYILLHETLHLLGAQDHYDPSTFRTTCDLPSCLMQYAPSEHSIGSQNCLCPATLAIIRRACA